MDFGIFEGFGVPTVKQAQSIKAMGFDFIVIGASNQDNDDDGPGPDRRARVDAADRTDKFQWRRNADKVREAVLNCREAGLRVWLLLWVRTALPFNETMREAVLGFEALAEVEGVLFDLELFFHSKTLLPRGMNHAEATAVNVVPTIVDPFREAGLRLGVTDYSSLPRVSRTLLQAMGPGDIAVPQVLTRDRHAKKRGSVYWPDRMPNVAAGSWLPQIPEGVAYYPEPAVYDLGGWKKARKRWDVPTVVAEVFWANVRHGATGVIPWSFRAGSSKRNRPALNAFADLIQRYRDGQC